MFTDSLSIQFFDTSTLSRCGVPIVYLVYVGTYHKRHFFRTHAIKHRCLTWHVVLSDEILYPCLLEVVQCTSSAKAFVHLTT